MEIRIKPGRRGFTIYINGDEAASGFPTLNEARAYVRELSK